MYWTNVLKYLYYGENKMVPVLLLLSVMLILTIDIKQHSGRQTIKRNQCLILINCVILIYVILETK